MKKLQLIAFLALVIAGCTLETITERAAQKPAVMDAENPVSFYTVVYRANGGSGDMEESVFEAGEYAELPSNSFTREGYVFAGWALSEKGAAEYSDGAEVTDLAAAGKKAYLYAVWQGIEYAIVYDANGGSGTMPASSHFYGEARALRAGSFTRYGYVFAGWAKTPSGAVEYEDGESVINLTAEAGAVIRLYAKWGTYTYTVRYHANNGTGLMADSQFTGGVVQNLRANTFTRSGYIFAGWALGTGGPVDFADGVAVIDLAAEQGARVTLYAVWNAGHVVIFNAAGGIPAPASQLVDYGGTISKPANPARTGYTFSGWHRDAACTIEWNFSSDIVTDTVILYAKWTYIEYYIVYDANGGSGEMEDSIFDIDIPQALSMNTFTRNGFFFIGWAETANGIVKYKDGETVSNLSAIPGATVTLYARWSFIDVAWIPAGSFYMGSPASEKGTYDRERPQQTVALSSGFYMGVYQVTQEQWTAVMTGNNNGISTTPSYFHGGSGREPASGEAQVKRPVEYVSWYNILVFCNRLSVSEGLTPAYRIGGSTDPDDWGAVPTYDVTWNEVEIVSDSTGYRLPTEAQWEYACRAGTTSAFNDGTTDDWEDETALGLIGWFYFNSNSRTHEVGKKAENDVGLYDMHGNVFEWCWDRYGTYPGTPQTDPTGASSGSYRIIRGGNWNGSARSARSAYRSNYSPNYQNYNIGFRLLRP
ncbi:MAG: InlB B-repeat-containing protein [Treponema sp.]|nr:InlB B-repeat-containing protein [Treponema sp.]